MVLYSYVQSTARSPTGTGLIYSAILARDSINSYKFILTFLSYVNSSTYDIIEKL